MTAFEISEDGTLKECENVGPIRRVRVDGDPVLVAVKLSRRDRRRRARRHRTRTQGRRVPAFEHVFMPRFEDGVQHSTTFVYGATCMGDPVELARFCVYAHDETTAKDAVRRNEAWIHKRFRIHERADDLMRSHPSRMRP